MNMHRVPVRTLLALAACSLLSAACGTSVPVRYLTLATPERACLSGPGSAAVVVIEKLTVPELVDRPQMVFRGAGSGVIFDEGSQWAEPLRYAIPRVLAEGLSGELGCAPVVLHPSGLEQPAWRLALDVVRLDARQAGEVDLEAVWTLTSGDGRRNLTRHVLRHEAWRGKGDDVPAAAAEAQARVVMELAKDIARAIRGEMPAAGQRQP